MFKGVIRGFSYSMGKLLFWLVLAVLSALLFNYLGISKAHALTFNDVNQFVKDSNSNYYYANVTMLPSEQYNYYNYYFLNEQLHLDEKIDLVVDYVTSRNFTNIDKNDIKYYVIFYGSFSGGLQKLDYLNSFRGDIVFYTTKRSNNFQQLTISSLSNNNNVTNYNLGYNLNIGASSLLHVSITNINNAFFTTDINNFENYLSTININTTNLDRNSSSPISFSSSPSVSINNFNIAKWNLTPYPELPLVSYLYHVDNDIEIILNNKTFLSSTTNTEITSCRIINSFNTCDENFELVTQQLYRDNGGTNHTNDNGYSYLDPSTSDVPDTIDYTEILNKIDSTLTDSSIDISGVDNLINDDKFNENETIQNIVRLPLNFISNLNTSCQPFSLTIPMFNADVSIPCMSTSAYPKILGSVLLNILKIVINGFLSYRILMNFVSLFNSLKDPTNDRLEVMQL